MRKGDETRQRIIAAAAPIFNQRGYSGCSIQALMEATGLEKGGIYRHFANKEEVALEAFKHALALNVKVRTDHIKEISGAIEKLRRAVQFFIDEPSVVPGGCPLMNAAIDADDGNPELRKLALKGIQQWRARISTIVKTGIDDGDICEEIKPERVANMLIATLEGALMISRLERNKDALRDAQASLELLFADISRAKTTLRLRTPGSLRRPVKSILRADHQAAL